MVTNSNSLQQHGIEQVDDSSTIVFFVTKGWQGIVAETADYSTKCFERNQALAGKLGGVKGIDEAIQLQSEFAKSAYEAFIAHATNIGSLYSDIA
ncbi:MAG: phasin family protein, partial [Roseiarcus sp.]